ncbi:MAG: phosphopyruvate hydratase [Patescibacteria group bacterium]|nr:phosphopyruvate hydratase [Patescibacteria group bacterium]
MKIKSIKALEILDSRGMPTVSAEVTLENDLKSSAAVPSGASTGSYEAVELRDADKSRYHGAGVLRAIKNIEKIIAPVLIGLEVDGQADIDAAMIALDTSNNKAEIGANAMLAVSLACARVAALSNDEPLYQYLTKFNPVFSGEYYLPMPMMNVLNGGKHANWATDIQEYMIIPLGAKDFPSAVRMCAEVYQSLKQILKDKHYAISVGDEGGFAPAFKNNEEPFQVLAEATKLAGYKLGQDLAFGIDAAATEFYHDGLYNLEKEGKKLDSQALINFYQELAKNHPIVSWEDVLAEDDWQGFKEFTSIFAPAAQVVGDDLYVTNVERLTKGIAEKSSNSILIKLNQIGTLTETVAAINLAREHGLTAVVSHRSGETEDTFIADLVVAMGTGQIKTGAPCRSERTAKYNRLLAIASELNKKAKLADFPFSVK